MKQLPSIEQVVAMDGAQLAQLLQGLEQEQVNHSSEVAVTSSKIEEAAKRTNELLAEANTKFGVASFEELKALQEAKTAEFATSYNALVSLLSTQVGSTPATPNFG